MASLEEASTAASAKKIVLRHLDERRDRWAKLFARSALILRYDNGAPSNAWMSFAVAAEALAAGREIKKIPIFEDILGQTLEVAAARAMEDLDEDVAWHDERLEQREVEAERQGELARLLKGSPLKPDQIDGYLTAVLIAPEFTSPNEWLTVARERWWAVPPAIPGLLLNIWRLQEALRAESSQFAVTLQMGPTRRRWRRSARHHR